MPAQNSGPDERTHQNLEDMIRSHGETDIDAAAPSSGVTLAQIVEAPYRLDPSTGALRSLFHCRARGADFRRGGCGGIGGVRRPAAYGEVATAGVSVESPKPLPALTAPSRTARLSTAG